MDLLDRLLEHDAWTTHQLLARCRDLTDAQLDQDFDLGHGTVRATLLHIIRNVEVWSGLMSATPVRASSDAEPQSIPRMIESFDRAHAALTAIARSVALRGAWDERW